MADIIVKESKHFRLARQISLRGAAIGSSATVSGISGFMNDEIVCEDIDLYKLEDLEIKNTLFNFAHYNVKWALFKGKEVLLKRVSYSKMLKKENSAMVLAYELKILKFIGSHPNIASSYGLVENPETPMAMYDHCINMYFGRYKLVNRPFRISLIKVLLQGLTRALDFIHFKDMIHLNMVEAAIVMKFDPNKMLHYPVIFDFSCCCPQQSAKVFDRLFQERFKSSNHLPIDVIKGKSVPSFSCDVYSLGVFVSHFANHMDNSEDQKIIDSVAISLLNTTSDSFPDVLYNFIE